MPNSNSQQKSSPDIGIRHQQAGVEQGGLVCIEGNLRELKWDSNPNCGIAREREGKKKWERENCPSKSPT